VERWPGAGEEWLAAAKHDGAEVESILIDKTGLGQASRQVWSGNVNLASSAFSLRITASTSSATSVALGPIDLSERDTTHFGWFRHTAAKSRSSAVPVRKVFVPITHYLVHAATVDNAGQATPLLDEETERRGRRRPQLRVLDGNERAASR
jgi:hypothetical protein